ncbi:MAG: marine proteobacterial sortase target protein [Thiotrichales bacterium]|nr:MAG: marine proteobacterial sortase target protein [Thiotrichales bacterium]
MKTTASTEKIKFKTRYSTHVYRLLGALALYYLFGLLANTVYAAEHHSNPLDSTHGSVWLLAEDQSYTEALLLETEVDIDIAGMIARTRVSQRFNNTGDLWAEGIYVFPLPDNAAVDHFKLRVGERIIEGQVQERTEARNTYSNARREGRQAGLVEQQRANVFTTSIANIPPGETLSVEIEYQQTIVFDGGMYRLRFPLVAGPRFQASTITMPTHDDDTDVSTTVSESPVNPVYIHVSLDAGVPVAVLNSSYHDIDIRQTDTHRYSIALASDMVFADRDFELTWQPELGHQPGTAVFSQHHNGYDYVLLSMLPPDMQSLGQHRLSRDVIFVLDVSGSMSGTSIKQARSSLIHALTRLEPRDRFNIFWFNDRTNQLYPASKSASAANIQHASNIVRGLQADGGTVMQPALTLALREQPAGNELRQIVFLTDGNVDNEKALFSLIRNQLGENRLFTVAIGSAPNSYFMRKAARAGRGAYTYIGKLDEVEEKTRALFEKMESPALVNIQVAVDGVDVEVFPDPVSDLYLGEPLTVLIRGKQLHDSISVYGDYGQSLFQQTVRLDDKVNHAGIDTAWAREKIASLMERHHDAGTAETRAALKHEIIQLSLDHHLVSRYSSLVAVDRTPVNTSGMLHSEKLKTSLPHGWKAGQLHQPESRQMLLAQLNLPQTATASGLHMMTSMMLFALAMVFYLWRKLL